MLVLPDGKRVLSAHRSGLRIWDLESGQELLHMDERAWALALLPSGKSVAAGGFGYVSVWNLDKGERTRKFRVKGAAGEPVPLSIGGTVLALGAADGDVEIYDLASGKKLTRYNAISSAISSVALSTNGKRLAVTGANEKEVLVMDARTGEEAFGLPYPGAWGAAFSPNSRRLVTIPSSASLSAIAATWDVLAKGQRTNFGAHKGWIRSLAIDPAGNRVATAGDDLHARIWGLEDGIQQLELPHAYRVTAVAWSPDGKKVVTGDASDTVRVWELRTGAELQTFSLNPEP